MKRILEFFKSNILIVKWTIGYFFTLWLILTYIFRFDVFSYRYWWRFFHGTLHGFPGFVFGALIYTAIPIYIASIIIILRKNVPIIKIPFLEKLFSVKKDEEQKQTTESEEPEPPAPTPIEIPRELPPELRVQYIRAKNNLSIIGTISTYNKPRNTQPSESHESEIKNDIPIPANFDFTDEPETESDEVPIFRDIDFDTLIEQKPEQNKSTIKYMESKGIEYKTYNDFIATEKYLIFEHNDNDFWIMEESKWFAPGKQIESPIPELIDIAKQEKLIPVIYFATQNIMNIDETISNFESNGIRVVKTLDELM